MGFVRRGGGGGGGEEDDGDEAQGLAHTRCAVCRRELLPWESVCPDDGGAAVTPGELEADPHDALLARLLAEGAADDPGAAGDAGAAGPGDDGDAPGDGHGTPTEGDDVAGDDPVWPSA